MYISQETPLLIYQHNLQPENLSKVEKAKNVFWGLKDRFWMQMIDGKYHHFGPMVFDNGLHRQRGGKEPGFFESLRLGCTFAGEHLGERLSLHFYKELHKKLCGHFKGIENNTSITADRTGIFSRATSFHMPLIDVSTEAKIHNNIFADPTSIEEDYQYSKQWLEKFTLEWEKKLSELNDRISFFCKEINIPEIVNIYLDRYDDRIAVYYKCPHQELESVVQILFNRYNEKIDQLNSKLQKVPNEEVNQLKSEKIEAIAELFQLLEWLHPFADGQGRTDLVLLAKLLSEQEFNPTILNEPYMSSWSFFHEWYGYLLEGLEMWKVEKEKVI